VTRLGALLVKRLAVLLQNTPTSPWTKNTLIMQLDYIVSNYRYLMDSGWWECPLGPPFGAAHVAVFHMGCTKYWTQYVLHIMNFWSIFRLIGLFLDSISGCSISQLPPKSRLSLPFAPCWLLQGGSRGWKI